MVKHIDNFKVDDDIKVEDSTRKGRKMVKNVFCTSCKITLVEIVLTEGRTLAGSRCPGCMSLGSLVQRR